MAKLTKPNLPGNRPSPFPPRTLSLCMIVKNEAAMLPDCLKSAAPAVDEIIIVDTGSTDDTVEIARSFGAKIIRSEWRDDFSFSRNLSLDNATSSWILWLDADDRLDEKCVASLRRLKTEIINLDTAFGFQVRNVKAGGLGDLFMQIRMFPNDKRVRFEKRIHEQVSPSLKRTGYRFMYLPEVEITHTGYFETDKKKEKALRNRRILEEDMANFPGDPNYLAAYGDTFFIVEEWEKGIAVYQKVFDLPGGREKQQDIHDYMPVTLALGYKNLLRYPEALEWVEKGLALAPGKLELLFLGGEIAYEAGRWDDAFRYYEAAHQAPEVVSTTPTDHKALKAKSQVRLGHLHRKAGRFGEARRLYTSLFEAHSNFHDLPGDIGETFLDEGNLREAIRWYSESLTRFPGLDERAYQRLGEVSERIDKVDDAVGFYEKGLSFFPESLFFMEQLKMLYRARNDLDRYLDMGHRLETRQKKADS